MSIFNNVGFSILVDEKKIELKMSHTPSTGATFENNSGNKYEYSSLEYYLKYFFL